MSWRTSRRAARQFIVIARTRAVEAGDDRPMRTPRERPMIAPSSSAGGCDGQGESRWLEDLRAWSQVPRRRTVSRLLARTRGEAHGGREAMSDIRNYRCLRCQHGACEVGEIRVAGGFWSKVFDVEGRRFTSVTCTRCKHTVFFKADRSVVSNVFDLFVGG
jgi:uncharacterized protein